MFSRCGACARCPGVRGRTRHTESRVQREHAQARDIDPGLTIRAAHVWGLPRGCHTCDTHRPCEKHGGDTRYTSHEKSVNSHMEHTPVKSLIEAWRTTDNSAQVGALAGAETAGHMPVTVATRSTRVTQRGRAGPKLAPMCFSMRNIISDPLTLSSNQASASWSAGMISCK